MLLCTYFSSQQEHASKKTFRKTAHIHKNQSSINKTANTTYFQPIEYQFKRNFLCLQFKT